MVSAGNAILAFILTLTTTSADYWTDREELVKAEESRMLGSSIILGEDENIANAVLMNNKFKEYDEGFGTPENFAAGKHFFDARKDIESSEVFKFIQKMPKGAALHGHDTALVSQEYLYNLTFRDNLYACTVDEKLKLHFFQNAEQDRSCNWRLISALRNEDPNYDAWVRSQLTLDVESPRDKYPNINAVWGVLNNIFATVTPMLTYRPVFEDHFYQALLELHQSGVMYLEFRGTLPDVYNLDGSIYSPLETVAIYQDIIKRFQQDHPDFFGARLIYAPVRRVDNATVANYVEIAKAIKQQYPDFLAGFDLVGQEDVGKPLMDFIEQLKRISSNIDFYFHAGETNWYGATTDLNLFDAILLDTKRIGHGYGLIKHPLLMEKVKERGIAVEVCPISNQVLMLVEDLRNHPAAHLMADNYPVIISYDDPTFWSTKGLDYDFYMAFMGMASRNADLKLLKQLAKNSLVYSSLSDTQKRSALQAWEQQWNKFISTFGGTSIATDKTNSLMLLLFALLFIKHWC